MPAPSPQPQSARFSGALSCFCHNTVQYCKIHRQITLIIIMANQKEYKRNKEGSKIDKIIIDRDLCIAASTCIVVTPETFQLDDENLAVVIDADTVDDDTLIQAAQSCPTQAIKLIDKDGKEV